MSRYDKRQKATNKSTQYKDVFDEKGVDNIKQFRTPKMKPMGKLMCKKHIWVNGDTFWKLSHDNYGDTKYWYVIAQYNSLPTEAHVNEGDTIEIPTNLTLALRRI